jgi:hypothetical protein
MLELSGTGAEKAPPEVARALCPVAYTGAWCERAGCGGCDTQRRRMAAVDLDAWSDRRHIQLVGPALGAPTCHADPSLSPRWRYHRPQPWRAGAYDLEGLRSYNGRGNESPACSTMVIPTYGW